MARHPLKVKQRTLGGVLGIIVLIFALGYYFVPDSLKGGEQKMAATNQSATHADDTGDHPQTIGFEPRPQSRHKGPQTAFMGPPLALAPSSVLKRQQQDQMAMALMHENEKNVADAADEKSITQWLGKADDAFQAHHLTGKDSALELYKRVLAADGESYIAARGIAKIHLLLLDKLRDTLNADDVDQAEAYVEQLKDVPGAGSDISKWQQVIEHFDRVKALLTKAQTLEGEESGVQADQAEQVAKLYKQVLQLDPDNQSAKEGLESIQSGLLEQALDEVKQQDYPRVNNLIEQAVSLLPMSGDLQDTRAEIEGIRQRQARDFLHDGRDALARGDIELATKQYEQARAARSDTAGLATLHKAIEQYKLYHGHLPGKPYRQPFLRTQKHTPQMLTVPVGKFMMGSSTQEKNKNQHEQPRHRVRFDKGFALSLHEISVAEFRQFIDATAYQTDAEAQGGSDVYDERTGVMRRHARANWRYDYAGNPAADDLPVVNISWNDAKAYAKWLEEQTGKNFDLPAEAQFAYALRAGSQTVYWWGDGSPDNKVENLAGGKDTSPTGRHWNHGFSHYADGFWGPAPVASFKANPFGLFDMGGNVSEWVRDCWHDNYKRAPRDGTAWENPGCTNRIIRGGAWGSSPQQSRSAWRQSANASLRGGRVGFRVVEQFD